MDEIDTSLLPGILREMTELIGLTATMAIVKEYGGVRLYIPVNAAGEHQIARLVGVDNLAKLMIAFGGETLEIGRAEAAIREIRNQEIKKQWPALSQRELALKYKTTERTIRNILSGCEQNDDQLELF